MGDPQQIMRRAAVKMRFTSLPTASELLLQLRVHQRCVARAALRVPAGSSLPVVSLLPVLTAHDFHGGSEFRNEQVSLIDRHAQHACKRLCRHHASASQLRVRFDALSDVRPVGTGRHLSHRVAEAAAQAVPLAAAAAALHDAARARKLLRHRLQVCAELLPCRRAAVALVPNLRVVLQQRGVACRPGDAESNENEHRRE